MRKLFLTFISLCLLVCLTGCGLKNKYTFRDFMCNMDEGHIEVTENGGRFAFTEDVDPGTTMLCDFHSKDGYYFVYWSYPDAEDFLFGCEEVPEDVAIHNENKTIYDLSLKEVTCFQYLVRIYDNGKQTMEDVVDILNFILDNDDYEKEVLKYCDYCEKHHDYYYKGDTCFWCEHLR